MNWRCVPDGFGRLERVVLVLVLVASGVSVVKPIEDTDYWWHLRGGIKVLQTRVLDSTDEQCLTIEADDVAGGPGALLSSIPPLRRDEYRKLILTGEWLFEVSIALWYSVFGHSGVILFVAGLFVLTIGASVLLALRLGLPGYLAPLFTGVLVWGVGPFIVPRPQVITYLFLVLVMAICVRIPKDPRFLFILPPLLILWSNFHQGYLVAIMVVAAFVVGSLLGKDRLRLTVWYSIAVIVVLVFSRLNANGHAAISAAVAIQKSLFTKSTAEWSTPSILDHPVFWLLFLASIVSLLIPRIRKGIRPAHFVVVIGFGGMASQSTRHIPLFLLAAAVLLAGPTIRALESGYRHHGDGSLGKIRRLVALVMSLCLAGTMLVTAGVPGLGVGAARTPFDAVKHINRLPMEWRVFNYYDYGGYLLFALDPPRPIFIDGRSLSEKGLWEHNKLLNANPPIYPSVLDRYGIGIVLLPIDSRLGIPRLFFELFDAIEWQVSFANSRRVVFIRTKGGTSIPELDSDILLGLALSRCREVVDQEARFGAEAQVYARMGRGTDAQAALESFASESGPNAVIPAYLVRDVGDRLLREGLIRQAIRVYQHRVDDCEIKAARAVAIARLRSRSEALPALLDAARCGACNGDLHALIDSSTSGLVDEPMADLSGARFLSALRSADLLIRTQGLQPNLLFAKGTALLRLCRHKEAIEVFNSCVELSGGITRCAPVVLANLGYALFDAGEFEQSFLVFEALLKRDPDDVMALYGVGLACKFMGRKQEALASFNQFLSKTSPSPHWTREAQKNVAELQDMSLFRSLR